MLSLESQAVNASCSQIHLFKGAGASVSAGELIALMPLVGDTHPDDRTPHIHFNLTVNGDSTKYCPSSFPGPTIPRQAFCYIPTNDPSDAVGN